MKLDLNQLETIDMKKLLLLIPFLVSCSEVGGMIGFDVSPTARQAYEDAGGTDIVATQADAVSTVTVTPSVSGQAFLVSLSECVIHIDLADKDPANADFWVSQPVTLSYDPDSFFCNTSYQCPYTAIMNGTTAELSFSCEMI